MREIVNKEIIALADGELSRGGTMRVICPVCSSPKRTMSITDTTFGLKYKCFRASCGVWGNTNVSYARAPARPKPPSLADKLVLTELPAEYAARLPCVPLHTPKYDPVNKRVLYQVRNANGLRRGYVGRHYPWISAHYGPKSVDIVERDGEPFIHYPKLVVDNYLVLVEDIPSAERIASEYQSCALIGTDVPLPFVNEWLALRIERLALILDSDALAKAYSIAGAWSGLFDIKVFNIHNDVKDMSTNEYAKLTQEIQDWMNQSY